MKRADVVVLEIDFDERLPVELEVIEHVSGEVELLRCESGQIGCDIARAVEQ